MKLETVVRDPDHLLRLINPGLYLFTAPVSSLTNEYLPRFFQRTDHAGSRNIYVPNVVRNQKYSLTTFLPLVLYGEFNRFANIWFLLVALSQFIPAFKIGASSFYTNFHLESQLKIQDIYSPTSAH